MVKKKWWWDVEAEEWVALGLIFIFMLGALSWAIVFIMRTLQ